MKNLLLFAVVSLTGIQLAAQNRIWQISGRIHNDAGEPLPGAVVQTNDSTGVFTDEKGYYILRQVHQPSELAVRRLGYFSRREVLRADNFQQGQLRLDIVLTAQDASLPEVDIVAQKLSIIAEEEGASYIYDYEFAGENLLLLLRDRKQHLLRLVTESGRILTQMQLPKRFVRLHRSCTGGVHLVGEYVAQELIISGLNLDTFPAYAIEKFQQIIEPCALQYHGHYFYRRAEQMNQVLRYWCYDTQGHYRPFAYTCSETGLREAWSAYMAFFWGKPMVPRPNQKDVPLPPPVDEGFDLMGPDRPVVDPQLPVRAESLIRLAVSDSQVAWLGSLKRIQLDSVYAPLMVVNDTLFLFDHPRAALRRFGPNLKQVDELPISYADAEGWKKELMKDEFTQTVYAHFAPKGRHSLSVVDVRTGQVTSQWPLSEVPYISHTFRVRNGFLYYLGRPKGDEPTQVLYKLNIRQKAKEGK